MLAGDLGFRAAAVLVLVVFPAIGFFIRRKWRFAVARQEEIKRLLALASEEAARAELEASIEYAASSATVAASTYVAPVVTSQRYCAVCYAPSTGRCRKCQSVRYCSSKCQVIHWRQGHKDECFPPKIDPDYSAKNHHDEDHCGKSTEEESCTSRLHAEDLQTKDNFNSYRASDGGTLASENSSYVASSVVSASSVDRKAHDDNWHVSEDGSLHDLGASDDRLLRPPADNLKKLEQTTLMPSPSSVLEFSNILDRPRPAREEYQCISTGPSDSDESEVLDPIAVSSGFWDGSLESSSVKRSNQSDSIKNCSGDHSADPHSDSEGSEQSYYTSADAPMKEAVFSKEEATNSIRSSRSILTSQQRILVDKEIKNGVNGTRAEEVIPLPSKVSFGSSPIVQDRSVATDSTKGCGSPSHGSARSKLVNGLRKESCQLPASERVGTAQNTSECSSFSDATKHSTSARESVEAGNGNGVVCNKLTSTVANAMNGMRTSILKVDQSRSLKSSRYYPFGVGSGATAKISEKGLFPYESFVKLYNWNKAELLPCGLINCGNSCYANVVLQCLTFTPPLTAYFLQALHSKACTKRDWCFTCEFERLIVTEKDRGSPLSPIGILSQVEKIGSRLANGREEDAHEFLRYAIDTMQSICLQEAGVSGTSKPLEEETTMMGLTFGGYLRSKIRCMRCRGKSERHERMMDLSVEIGGDIETLEEALQKFTATEILDGENKYQCTRCKSYEKAKKKLTIMEAPNVLTIALKRFQSGKFGKLNKPIRFPDILNLVPYMRSSGDKSPIYRLYGVVVHLDVMNATFSGHYVCYIRNAQNKWFKIDDSTVKAVDMDGVMRKGAYMLFYSRFSPRAPQSIRKSFVPSDVVSKKNSPKPKPSPAAAGKSNVRPSHPSQVPHPFVFISEPGFPEPDTSSETSSIFSQSSEGTSTTDSTRESSTSADDLLDHFFGDGPLGRHTFWRTASDSDTSSSSSASSSPLYVAGREASFWQSDTTQGRRLVDSSSCRETNPLSSEANSGGAYLRPLRKPLD